MTTLVDVPEESCDLQPLKTCQHGTKLLPYLTPTKKCGAVPKQAGADIALLEYPSEV